MQIAKPPPDYKLIWRTVFDQTTVFDDLSIPAFDWNPYSLYSQGLDAVSKAAKEKGFASHLISRIAEVSAITGGRQRLLDNVKIDGRLKDS